METSQHCELLSSLTCAYMTHSYLASSWFDKPHLVCVVLCSDSTLLALHLLSPRDPVDQEYNISGMVVKVECVSLDDPQRTFTRYSEAIQEHFIFCWGAGDAERDGGVSLGA